MYIMQRYSIIYDNTELRVTVITVLSNTKLPYDDNSTELQHSNIKLHLKSIISWVRDHPQFKNK
jgi:hypothetical protein